MTATSSAHGSTTVSAPTPAPILFAAPAITSIRREDGSLLLRSAEPLAAHPATIIQTFRDWAARDGDVVLARQRDSDGRWRTLTYGEADTRSRAVGEALLELGLSERRPLLILSENSLEHLTLVLGALSAGIPVGPVSVAYSLQSGDHSRLRQIGRLLQPGAVFADDAQRYAQALEVLKSEAACGALKAFATIVSTGTPVDAVTFDQLTATEPGPELDIAFTAITEHTVAKILMTSGSTGAPKGVLTTHGMLAANQQMMRQAWPFLADQRPEIVDWLPWSHTFGGSHNVGLILVNGGTLTIDAGRPAPDQFPTTIENLSRFPPTIYFNVPAGFAQLIPVLESDPTFARQFFSRLRLVFNAAAALPNALRARLQTVAQTTTGNPIAITGSWGLTETAPAVTNAHFDFDDARNIGVPLPGCDVRLIPGGDGYEIRVRGSMVTPGYLNRPDLNDEVFDTDGFFVTGDAVQLADAGDPNAGLLFRGRLAEDFKLATGTFVRVGALRTSLLSAIPVLSDAVITGENQSEVCALAWLNAGEVRARLGRDAIVAGDVIDDPELADLIADALGEHASCQGSAGRVARLLLMSQAADLDAGEITDKGYVNQRRVLANRTTLADQLYSTERPAAVIAAARSNG